MKEGVADGERNRGEFGITLKLMSNTSVRHMCESVNQTRVPWPRDTQEQV